MCIDPVIESLVPGDPLSCLLDTFVLQESQLDQAPDHISRQAGNHIAMQTAVIPRPPLIGKCVAVRILGATQYVFTRLTDLSVVAVRLMFSQYDQLPDCPLVLVHVESPRTVPASIALLSEYPRYNA